MPRLVAVYRWIAQHRTRTWIATLVAFLFGVVLTFKRPHVQATTSLSSAQFTVRQDLALRPVLTSAITTLNLIHFEHLELGDKRCTSTKGEGVAKLTVPKGALSALTLGAGRWSLEVGKLDDPSRGAFTLARQKQDSRAEVYADTEAGLIGTLEIENCAGYEAKGNLTLGERLTVRGGATEVYASYADTLSVPLFSEVCIDEISGNVAAEWELQRRYWESCVLSPSTEPRRFALSASASCPPPDTPQALLRKETGGIRLISLGFDSKRIEAKFRWPHEAEWSTELSGACTFTFWEKLGEWIE